MSFTETTHDIPMYLSCDRFNERVGLYRKDYGWFTPAIASGCERNANAYTAVLACNEDDLLRLANWELKTRRTVPSELRREVGGGIVKFTAIRRDPNGEPTLTPLGLGYPVLATATVRTYN